MHRSLAKIGRKIAFILKIYQSTEAELQENIKCCTCWDKVALENTWETNPCVGKWKGKKKKNTKAFKNSGFINYHNTYNKFKQGKMLLLRDIHGSSSIEHSYAMLCISEATEPTAELCSRTLTFAFVSDMTRPCSCNDDLEKIGGVFTSLEIKWSNSFLR